MNNIRNAARTIILDENSRKIAILEVKNGDYHKIPGGGIKKNESVESAATREALEEAGCEVELIKKIGELQLEFADPDDKYLHHHSVCFLARKIKEHKTTYFTEEEREKKFRLLWTTFEEAIELFEAVKSKLPNEIAMNNRDLKFIKIAKEYIGKNGLN